MRNYLVSLSERASYNELQKRMFFLQVSSLPSSPLQEKSPPLGSTPIDQSGTSGLGRSPPSTRTSPIATPSMSFKRSHSGKFSAGKLHTKS